MNMMKKVSYLGFAAAMSLACGCTQSSNVISPVQHPFPMLAGIWASSNFSATFQVVSNQWVALDSSIGGSQEATVYLWDTVDHVPVNGGAVTMGGTTIPQVDESSFGGGKYYDYFNCPMTFAGGNLICSASGSSSFPALVDTIHYPNSLMSVNSPGVAVTLSKASGFTVGWTHISGSTDTIAILISGDSAGSFKAVVPDNGSYPISSTNLSSFTTGGKISITVSRISYKISTDALGRIYGMASSSNESMDHILNP